MSLSILYHCFGVVKVEYLKTEFLQGQLIFRVRLRDKICSRCQSYRVTQKGKKYRMIQTVPVGLKLAFINLEVRRFHCADCGAIAQESYDQIAAPKKHYSKKLVQFVCSLSYRMTVNDIASYLNLHWNTVWEMLSSHLEKSVPTARELRKLRHIGIDEIAVRKGHHYLTLVIDHDSGRVVHIAEGRNAASIRSFLKRLRRLKAPVEVVTTDMWTPYITAILEILPSSHIVYDKYHIIANLNKCIDELRRKEYSLNSKLDRSIIKGTRFLLLKHPDKLNQSAREKLKKLFRVNKSLATCYQMKEMLYQLWRCQNIDDAKACLILWCKMAQETAIQPLIKFANLMLAHRTAVLNYFKYPFTNARVEGLNNKIKTLKRQAYGFRNMANFFLKIFSIHKSRYALIG